MLKRTILLTHHILIASLSAKHCELNKKDQHSMHMLQLSCAKRRFKRGWIQGQLWNYKCRDQTNKKYCIWELPKTHFASWLPKILPYGKVSTGSQCSEKKHIIQKGKYKSKPLNILQFSSFKSLQIKVPVLEICVIYPTFTIANHKAIQIIN